MSIEYFVKILDFLVQEKCVELRKLREDLDSRSTEKLLKEDIEKLSYSTSDILSFNCFILQNFIPSIKLSDFLIKNYKEIIDLPSSVEDKSDSNKLLEDFESVLLICRRVLQDAKRQINELDIENMTIKEK